MSFDEFEQFQSIINHFSKTDMSKIVIPSLEMVADLGENAFSVSFQVVLVISNMF